MFVIRNFIFLYKVLLLSMFAMSWPFRKLIQVVPLWCPSMCPFQNPLYSPANSFLNSSKETSQPSSSVEQGASSDDNGVSGKTKNHCRTPSRRESYSDHSESGEDDSVRAPAKMPNVTQVAAFPHEAPRSQEESICAMFYLPRKIPGKLESESRYCRCYSVQSSWWGSRAPAT